MFKNLKVILSLANTDTVADFDNSTEEHVNIQRDLDTKLKKLEGQKFPQGFSKPTYVLKAVDANEHSQWETQLQQESKENTGKRIILIPYYLGNSHWVGIIIQFKGTHAIQEIEFIDPVSNSSFVHENIQQKFNDLYPRVTLPSKTLQTHNDPTQSNRLTIENLLKRVEELQLMDVQTEIIDNQKTYTSLSEVNTSNVCHSKQAVSIEKESAIYVSASNSLFLSSQTEQQKEQNEILEKSSFFDRENIFPVASSNQTAGEKSTVTPSPTIRNDDYSQVKSCESIEKQLQDAFHEFEISNEKELEEEILKTQREIQECNNQGRGKVAGERQNYLLKLKEIQALVSKIIELQPLSPSPSKPLIEELKVRLSSGLSEHELKDEKALKEEIMKMRQEIQEAESLGRQKTAEKIREPLTQLEKLQDLVDQIAAKQRCTSTTTGNIEELRAKLDNGLSEHELMDEKALKEEIMKMRQKIQEAESSGRQNTAAKMREPLTQLEELQSIANQINALQPLQVTNDTEVIRLHSSIELLDEKVRNNDIIRRKSDTRSFTNGEKYESVSSLEKAQQSFDHSQVVQFSPLSISDKFDHFASGDHPSNVDGSNNCLAQDEDTITKRSVKNLHSDFSCMPPCSERSIIRLRCLLSLKLLNEVIVPEDNIVIPNSIESEIAKEWKCLNERLKIEEFQSSQLQDLIRTLEVNIKDQNWKSAFSKLVGVLKLIRPLNIQELFRLIEKVDDAAKLIKGKEIILLVGGTGAGKSTTIHFLGGSKFKKIKVNGLNHIHPYEVKNTDLQKITTSPFARSETRYITPVRVNPGDVSGYTGDGFVLCDSPGFEDTNGAEVDIANGVGITKAIKGCKSVKLVILISAMSIGDRQGGVKNLARTLIGLIPGIKDHIRAVAYIFTKFSLEEKDTIHHLLKDAEQRMDEADKSDISYMLLFRDLVRKTRRNVRIIDPLEGDPLDMIDDFDDFQVINHPDEVFKFSITDKSKATVQEQIRKDQLSIMSATERSDFLFVKYKMDLLKRLYDALDQEYIKQIYDDCVENIVRHLTEEYKGATSVISRGLINERILSNEDIRYYETCINHATLAEDLRESHLKQKVVHSSAFIQYLSQQMDDMFIELHDKEINNSLIKGSLDKMKLVLNSFPRINPEKYNSTCQALAEKIKSVTTSFKTSVLSNKFDESASSITKLHEALNVLHDHLDRAYMQEEYNRMKEYFLNHIDTSVKNLTRVFDHEKLLKDDINSLNSCVSMLEGAMKTYALHPHISKKEIEKIYENLLSKILNYFQGIVQKIDAEFNNKNAFYTLRQFLEELDSIRTISVIEIKTNQFHYSIVEKIVRYLRDAKLDAEDLLKIVFQRDGKVNYDKLTKCLLNLKNAEWIEKYRSGEYSYIIKDVEERLIEHITEMKVTVMQVPLNLDNYDKIDSVHKIVSDIKEMKPLEKFLPDINQHIVDVNSWFEKEINGVCIIIKASFNTEEWKKEEEKNLDFKKVEKALQYFDACKRNCISLHNDFLCVPSDLEGFVKYHSDFVQKEMESCFENMRNFQIEGKENTEQCQKERRENLFEKARILSKRLIEVSEIKTEYCRIFACYTNQRILEQWEQRLNDYHSELTNEIEMLSATNQNLTLNNKLLTVNALRALDVPPGKTKFTNLYYLYQNKILVTTNDAVGKVLDAIKTYDYARVARGMGSLKIAGNGGEYFFEEAKQALTRSLDDFIGEIKTQAIMIGNNLEPEKIKSIVTNLKRIREAKQFISQYLDKPDELEKCIEDVKSTLETRLKRVLDGVNTLINVNSFYEAEQKIESIFFVRDLLDQYCTPALFAELEKASERQKGVVLNEIVPKYEKMDISRYMLNPPTDIFEKFGAAKNANSVYSQALEKIKETILTKFREELDLARNEEPPNPNSSHIRRFESAVKYLPEAMKNDLEVALTHCKADIDLKIDDNAKNLRNVISNEDPKAIKVVLQPNRNSQTIDPLRKEGRELILKQVQDKVNKIDQYFQQDNVNEALAYVKIVFDYHNELGSIITDIRQPYLTVRSQTKNKFEAVYLCFLKQFLQNNTSDVTIEIVSTIEKSFRCIFDFIKFKNESQDSSMLNNMLPEDFNEKVIALNNKTSEYFRKLENGYKDQLEKMDILSLKHTLDIMVKWESLITKIMRTIQMCDIKDDSLENMKEAIESLTHYSSMLESVSRKLQELKVELINQELINAETSQFDVGRDQFYKKFNEKLLILDKAKDLSGHDLRFDVKIVQEKCINSIKRKIADIFAKINNFLKKFASESRLKGEDYDEFNLCYANLVSLHQAVRGIDFEVNEKISQIKEAILTKVRLWEQTIEKEKLPENISKSLINMKHASINIHAFKVNINKRIDETLNNYKNRAKSSTTFSKLGILLNKDPDGVGASIIAEHKAFESYSLSLFNEKTQRHDINYVLSNLKGDFIAINKLKKRCIEFFGARRKSNNSGNSSNVVHVEPDADESDGIYTKLIENYLKINIDFQKLISETKLIAGDIKQTPENIQWDAYVRDRIPKLIAHIFALWTLQNASSYFDVEDVVDRKNYLLQPHAAQVVSIFRMLGVGDENEKLKNNLVQIGTGEGKSITLGVTASVLALLGFDVRCACYSPYLSQRDYNGFLPVFDALGVTQYIRYGTFNKLCEDMINQNGDIRQIVEQVISTNSFNTAQSTHRTERAKILLIDEVDVFFSQDFYGNLYTPSASLREPTITSLINYIWAQRESKLNLSKVTTTPEYKACCNKFPDWEPLILEAVKDLIYDVNSFESHDYICNNDMIGYKEQDNIVYNVAYGYKTLFAYYCEHVKQQITQKSLEERISMRIKCGSFSYAEIPLQFKYIMGVTGTLETLSDPEKRIIKNVYKIEKNTIAPSVFGANNLIFRMRDDIRIENNDDYFNAIKREIDDRLVGRSVEKRAILVFFESKQKLEKFFNSRALETMNGSLQILTEEASSEEKETKIKRATRSGQVTLFTRTFGRGTDFICYDQNVSANGGAHVIQTFLSEECSEEKQIKGRTARQGDNGSYSMILFDRDLEKFHIQRENIDDVVQGKGISVLKSDKTVSTTVYETLYQLLDDKRTALFKTQYEANMAFVQQAKEKHEVTRQFLLSLNYGDLNFAKTFLVKENKGAFIIAQQSRTICLMDATGSMTHLLHKCKTTVGMMFDRITMILKENNISEDSFQIQFVVYRNYNSEKDKILQSSPWETKPDNLRAFMNAINVEGGWGNEAVEIGLWHANTENERENITQVILIGDAPPNTKTEVDQKRDNYGDAYWKNTKFAEATYYEDELKKLISKQIPVHAFYVAKQAEASFKKIAKETGGRCHLLDINSQAGANMLTDLVTEVILKNVGGEAKGNTLVDAYRKKFGKSYN